MTSTQRKSWYSFRSPQSKVPDGCFTRAHTSDLHNKRPRNPQHLISPKYTAPLSPSSTRHFSYTRGVASRLVPRIHRVLMSPSSNRHLGSSPPSTTPTTDIRHGPVKSVFTARPASLILRPVMSWYCHERWHSASGTIIRAQGLVGC
jgi:hypothetical protein